jgi:glyoxylase-like metal-dependent hydrolase (beta-lactamase superfamily II)
MIVEIADGVDVHQSECILSNSVIVHGADGILLVDPGLTRDELEEIAERVRASGRPVTAGFATHPDWDHVLWHPALGDAPRYGTPRCAAELRELLAKPDWRELVAEGLPPEIGDDVPINLLGEVSGLPDGATEIPWNGPRMRVLEHRAHSPGHAALVIDGARVLVAGDMLSDVLVPMLDLQSGDPTGDYLAALDLLETVVDDVDVVVPGHGTVTDAAGLRARIGLDRAYVHALRSGREPDDPRLGASAQPGWEWVTDLHTWQAKTVSRLVFEGRP